MKIGGIHRFSLIDFPGKIACTLFTLGCNFRCSFCHNASLVLPQKFAPTINMQEIEHFLNKRKNQLQGVVISGGEPLLHEDLIELLTFIKSLKLEVKLDTNGSFPKRLKHLIDEGLLDYIAMDIKNTFSKYDKTCGCSVDLAKIKESIEIITTSNLPHHFRTTFYKEEISETDIDIIQKEIIPENSKFIIQDYKETPDLLKNFM